MDIVSYPRNRRLLWVLVALSFLFMAAWLPRVAQLDSFVTPDERRWLQRSGNFLFALERGDFASTYQAGHPGVTVMWAGTVGFLMTFPSYPAQVMRPLNENDFDSWIRTNSEVPLLQLLVAGRRWIVLAISLLIALSYLPLSTLFGSGPAFLATLFVAWEPFHIGLSRQLHPDGLLAAFVFFAFTSFLAWLHDRQRRVYLILSGVATGLALLTKSPALVLPFVMLILTIAASIAARNRPERRRNVWRGLLELLTYSALTIVLLWPATWTLWQDAFVRVFNLALEYSQQGHELPLFFWGKTVNNPGPLFYPMTFLMRATPATLFGLVGVAIGMWRGWYPLRLPKTKQTIAAFLLFAVIYTTAITFSEKKMDRYLLPAMPFLTVVAAIGWVGVASAVGRAWRQPVLSGVRVPELATLGIALILLHGISSAIHFPYYLTYYNPLLGGSRTAPKMMMVGWGEGLDQAAKWLNQQTERPAHRVVAWYGDGPLSYFLDPTIEVLPFYSGGRVTEEYWFNADYAVLYVNQWQRENPSSEIIEYFLAHPPAHTVRFAGLDLVYIYSLRDLPPPEVTYLHRISPAIWDGRIELAGYYLKDTTIFPGEKVITALFWQAIRPIEQKYALELTLRDTSGAAIWSTTRSPAGIETNDWPVDKLWRDTYMLEIPTEIGPGDYELVAIFRDANGEVLPWVVAPPGQELLDEAMLIETLSVQEPTVVEFEDAEWQRVRLASIAAYAESVAPGSAFLVDVTATIDTDAPLKLSLRLVNGAGEVIAQNDQIFQPTMRFRLPIPLDATPGSYTLAAVLYDPATLAPLPDQQGAFSVGLTGIEIK